jgi:hypothetical protein
VAMDECEFHSDCLMHFGVRVLSDTFVYVHFLPWYPIMDVFLLLGDRWVQVVGCRYDFCLDYDWVLEWFLGVD